MKKIFFKYSVLVIIILTVVIFILCGCTGTTGMNVYISSMSGSPCDIDVAFTDHDNSASTNSLLNAIPNLTATAIAVANTKSTSSLIGIPTPSAWTLTQYTVQYTVVSSNAAVPATFAISSYTSGVSVRLTAGSSAEVIIRPMDHVTQDWFVGTVYPTYGAMSLKAVVTFTGKDDIGRDVSVSGEFDINCEDFAYNG